MPLYSKIPVVPSPDIPVCTGLMCAHPNCFALFLNLDDSEVHAIEAHAGEVVAVSCAISEHQLENGEVELLRILDKDGEHRNNPAFTHG